METTINVRSPFKRKKKNHFEQKDETFTTNNSMNN